MCVCVCVCVLAYVRAIKGKTILATNVKLDTHILYDSRSACVDLETKGQRSRSHGYENRHVCTANIEEWLRPSVLMLLVPACGTARRMTAWVSSLFYRCVIFVIILTANIDKA